MIIELLLDCIYGLFNLLTSPIEIPPLPDEIHEYISLFFDLLSSGAGILANYVPVEYLMTLFGVVMLVDIGIKLYHFVLWILKKIPMAGIS